MSTQPKFDNEALRAMLASLDPKMAAALMREANPDAAQEMRKRGAKIVRLPTDPIERAKQEITLRKEYLSRAIRTIEGSPDSLKPRKRIDDKIADIRAQLNELVALRDRSLKIVESSEPDILALRDYVLTRESGKGAPWPTLELSWDFLTPTATAEDSEVEETADVDDAED